MTPKEKALDLFKNLRESLMWSEDSNEDAKQCALIAVDEILPIVQSYEEALSPSQTSDEYEYWLEVKQEIEKL